MNREISMPDQLTSVLEKLVMYIKLANYDAIRNRLMEVLNTPDKRRVFETTDGNNSTRDIESSTGVNKDVVSNWWNEWQKEGIVEQSQDVRGRRRRVLSLADFGIDIPHGKREHVKTRKAKKD